MAPHVAIVDPAMRIPELDCFNRMSRRSRIPLTYHLPALHGLDSLATAGDDLRGVVVLGSGASVNEPHAWQDALRDWLRPRIEAGIPMLGLCYGHQLFAELLGGQVDFQFPDQHKEHGLRRIRLAADPLWGPACDGILMVSHREAVVEVPSSLAVVGSSEVCAVEVLAHRTRPLWSFQAHPEATPAFAVNNDVPFDAPAEVLDFGHRLVDAFLDRTGATGGA